MVEPTLVPLQRLPDEVVIQPAGVSQLEVDVLDRFGAVVVKGLAWS